MRKEGQVGEVKLGEGTEGRISARLRRNRACERQADKRGQGMIKRSPPASWLLKVTWSQRKTFEAEVATLEQSKEMFERLK